MVQGTFSGYKKFRRGSEWRLWDLHIHTPNTALNDQFKTENNEDKWDKFISTIEENQAVKVIGVTDYLSIDNYKTIIKYQSSGRLKNIDLIVPNIEFRLTPETSENKGVNLHLLIKDCNSKEIQKVDEALSRLNINIKEQPYSCTKSNLIQLGRTVDANYSDERAYQAGVNQYKVSLDSFKEWYKKEKWLKDNSLIAISNSSEDGASGLQKDSGFYLNRQEYYLIADIIFSGKPKDAEYFLGQGSDNAQKVKKDKGSLKPCVHGSDAHSFEKLFKPDHDRYCWIKADTTFEGLKQVVYEPADRVRIQKENPANGTPDRYFSAIKLEKGKIFKDGVEFVGEEIPLNKNMIAIIGGRGSGKSLLLDGIANTLANPNSDKKIARPFNKEENIFEITYSQAGKENIHAQINNSDNEPIEYLHVSQGDVKGIVEDPSKLSDEIKKLLKIDETSVKNQPYNEDFKSNINSFREADEFINDVDINGNIKNNTQMHESIKTRNQQLIDQIKNEKNKDAIENYIKNKKSIEQTNIYLQSLDSLERSAKIEIGKLNNEVKNLNSEISVHLSEENLITELEIETQLEEIKSVREKLDKKKGQLTETNRKIEEGLKKQGIQEDISTLFKNVSLYEEKILRADEEIKKIKSMKAQKEHSRKSLYKDAWTIIQKVKQKKLEINKEWEKLQKGGGWDKDKKAFHKKLLKGIEIIATADFDKQKFYNIIGDFFDGRKKRNIELSSIFNVDTFDNYKRLIKGEKIIQYDNKSYDLLTFIENHRDFFLPQDNIYKLIEMLYLDSYFNEFIKVLCSIKYDNKPPEKLSVGQRGTFYICLKLATDTFVTPFVFDQPEDDMDNNFIMNRLVPIFKEIKKYRQVIIATHNANFVVNTDVEQVIIANNREETLNYYSGSLEGQLEKSGTDAQIVGKSVYENICDILEGGKDAFLKRKKKYNVD